MDSEEEEEILDEGFLSDDDPLEENVDGPYINLSKKEKERIRKPWKKTLIVKLLGRPISYMYLCNRVKQLWRWTPGFRSEEATINSVATWVRFPGMLLEFYDGDVLRRMGNEIGKAVRIDRTTSFMLRGKFARMCVELDLTKPLVSKIYIGGRWQKVEYEGLKMLCFHCGKFGHNDLECGVRKKQEQGFTEEQALKLDKCEEIPDKDYENEKFRLWMISKKKYRKPIVSKQKNPTRNGRETSNKRTSDDKASGSRFVVLEDDDICLNDDEFVPSTFEPVEGDTLVPTKRTDSKVQQKETFKKNLQNSAEISNRSGRKKSSKGKNVQENSVQIAFSKDVNPVYHFEKEQGIKALQDVINVVDSPLMHMGKQDTEISCHTNNSLIIRNNKDRLYGLYEANEILGRNILQCRNPMAMEIESAGVGVNGAARERLVLVEGDVKDLINKRDDVVVDLVSDTMEA
ncbi:hypothetical protein REPUB_Repub06bG0077800 [Reevesia pubescens]